MERAPKSPGDGGAATRVAPPSPLAPPRGSNAVIRALLPATRARIRGYAANLVNQKGYGRHDAVKTTCYQLADELGYPDGAEELFTRAILDGLV